MSGLNPRTVAASTAPPPLAEPTRSNESLSTGPPASDPGVAGGTPEAPCPRVEAAQRNSDCFMLRQEAQPPNLPSTRSYADLYAQTRERGADNACIVKGDADSVDAAPKDHRDNLYAQSYSSFVLSECPALDPTEASHQLRKPPVFHAAFLRSAAQLSAAADRIMVLLWRAFTFRLRYPIMTLIGLLAPGETLIVLDLR